MKANFDHTILSLGQHMCYKCGEVSKNRAMMINYIKSTHGQELCKKERHKKYDFGESSFYKHIPNPVQSVVQNLRIPLTVFTQQVFSNLPTTGHPTLTVGEQKMYQMMNQMMSRMMKEMILNKE